MNQIQIGGGYHAWRKHHHTARPGYPVLRRRKKRVGIMGSIVSNRASQNIAALAANR